AGDDDSMKAAVDLAIQYNVRIGAHPSFPDTKNFGRTSMSLPVAAIFDLVAEQVFKLSAIASAGGAPISHVKPHGALYNMAAMDREIAETIATAVYTVNPSLSLFGLAGSFLILEGRLAGLKTVNEVFADRTYQDDGSLTPRTSAGALIEDVGMALQQVMQMVVHEKVRSVNGKDIAVLAETICIHGDGPHSATIAKAIYDLLIQQKIEICAPSGMV
ncbi:MAG TPA: 5-oxoprolinase subunit PxpA, partial [Puia sp.]|nr:5-oxoprolinase subunit PxpA [Puia sp.]